MTERTTDREALAGAQQAGVDAFGAQREAGEAELWALRRRWRMWESVPPFGREVLDEAFALAAQVPDLRADVTRLEGKRETLRGALAKVGENCKAVRYAWAARPDSLTAEAMATRSVLKRKVEDVADAALKATQ